MTSTDKKAVLVVAQDPQTRQWLASWLHNNGFNPIAADSIDSIGGRLDGDTLLVISDIDSPQNGVNRLTNSIRTSSMDVPVIVLAGQSSLDKAVQSIQDGATDYLLKPINTAELSAKLKRAINERKLARDLAQLQTQQSQGNDLNDEDGEIKTLQSLEREAIINTLDRFSGARGKTAKALGISVRTLQRKIKEYGYQGNKPSAVAPRPDHPSFSE